MSLIREFFSSYLPRRAHPDLPLVLLRQHFPAGEHTGHHLHEDFFALYVVQGGRVVFREIGEMFAEDVAALARFGSR